MWCGNEVVWRRLCPALPGHDATVSNADILFLLIRQAKGLSAEKQLDGATCQEAAGLVVDEHDEVPGVQRTTYPASGYARGSSSLKSADRFGEADSGDPLCCTDLHPSPICVGERYGRGTAVWPVKVRPRGKGAAGRGARLRRDSADANDEFGRVPDRVCLGPRDELFALGRGPERGAAGDRAGALQFGGPSRPEVGAVQRAARRHALSCTRPAVQAPPGTSQGSAESMGSGRRPGGAARRIVNVLPTRI